MSIVHEKIEEKNINNILSESFLNYSMSVIVSRAIPDVRDGLKPVHRRILYAMNTMNMTHKRPYKKSARIVGEVIGKYHPHGDSAVYGAMVRMAQSWKTNLPLIDEHGNFGSIDGDSPAAMRYTEARMSKASDEMLKGIQKDTVDFVDNFDGEEQEPVVLPGRIPNLLVNGSDGIAVGLATSIPPHNVTEVCDAIIKQIDNENITLDELLEVFKGPDFPTGALITNGEDIKKIYETGRGSVKMRGKVEREFINGREALVITEIPFNVNKKKLIQQIKDIQLEYDEYMRELRKGNKNVNKKGMDFIYEDEIRDETDSKTPKNKVRIVIVLKDGVNPNVVENYLYKHTLLEKSFGVNMLALVPEEIDGKIEKKPKLLSLKEVIREYIKHQKEIKIRELKFELNEKEKEKFLLEGLVKAIKKIDETIKIIRNSKTREESINGLIDFLKIDEKQAKYILSLQLQTLASFEQEEKVKRYEQLLREMEELKQIISDDKKINKLIKEQLNQIKEEFGSPRRTEILSHIDQLTEIDWVEDVDVLITITKKGFIKKVPEINYKSQRRKGVGIKGTSTFENDFVNQVQIANNHDTLMFFSNKGKIYKIKTYQLPNTNPKTKGVSINSIFDLEDDEYIQTTLSIKEFSDKQYLLFGTKEGLVKKTLLSEYNKSNRNGIAAITLKPNDELVNVCLTNGEKIVTLLTEKGMLISFKEDQISSVSRIGKGIKGINLKKGDSVVSVVTHNNDLELFLATNKGIGKRTLLTDYKVQNRGGKGVRTIPFKYDDEKLVGALCVDKNDEIILSTKSGMLLKLNVSEISLFGRKARGSKIISLKNNDELQTFDRNALI